MASTVRPKVLPENVKSVVSQIQMPRVKLPVSLASSSSSARASDARSRHPGLLDISNKVSGSAEALAAASVENAPTNTSTQSLLVDFLPKLRSILTEDAFSQVEKIARNEMHPSPPSQGQEETVDSGEIQIPAPTSGPAEKALDSTAEFNELVTLRLEKRLDSFVKEKSDGINQCMISDCGKLFRNNGSWRKHVDNRHAEWLQDLKSEVGLRPASSAVSIPLILGFLGNYVYHRCSSSWSTDKQGSNWRCASGISEGLYDTASPV